MEDTDNRLRKSISLNKLVCSESSRHTKVLVTMDMDLYKKAIKLERLNAIYSEKWMLCPGGFHIVICALRCLGRTIEHSGLDEAWARTLYSSITVTQIINGKHYNRAIQAHEITLEVLFNLWISAFFKETPAVYEALVNVLNELIVSCRNKMNVNIAHQKVLKVIEEINLEKQLHDFDKTHNDFPLYKWARMYMRQVMSLLNFLSSIKDPDIYMYLASLENLCKYFFSYNRLDYALNITEYLARVNNTRTTDPNMWNLLKAGGFALKSNSIPFAGIAVDQGQEFLNKILKGDGGLRGITNRPAALLQFCLTASELARLALETEELIGVNPTPKQKQHHHLSSAKFIQRQNNVEVLFDTLEPCNIFESTSPQLYNVITKQVVTKEIEKDILNIETRGEKDMKSFVKDCICGSENLWAPMKKLEYFNWNNTCKKNERLKWCH